MAEPPLDPVYVVVFIDAIQVMTCEGQASEAAAIDALAEFSARLAKRYPAITHLWENLTDPRSHRSCQSGPQSWPERR